MELAYYCALAVSSGICRSRNLKHFRYKLCHFVHLPSPLDEPMNAQSILLVRSRHIVNVPIEAQYLDLPFIAWRSCPMRVAHLAGGDASLDSLFIELFNGAAPRSTSISWRITLLKEQPHKRCPSLEEQPLRQILWKFLLVGRNYVVWTYLRRLRLFLSALENSLKAKIIYRVCCC